MTVRDMLFGGSPASSGSKFGVSLAVPGFGKPMGGAPTMPDTTKFSFNGTRWERRPAAGGGGVGSSASSGGGFTSSSRWKQAGGGTSSFSQRNFNTGMATNSLNRFWGK